MAALCNAELATIYPVSGVQNNAAFTIGVRPFGMVEYRVTKRGEQYRHIAHEFDHVTGHTWVMVETESGQRPRNLSADEWNALEKPEPPVVRGSDA